MRKKPQHRRKLLIIIGILFLIFFGRIILEAVKFSPVFLQYLFQRDVVLHKTENRVNMLLLGVGGGTHDGPLLTDTIMYASIDPEKQKVTLISLPRDLWVPDLMAKINTAYAFGEQKQKGGGIILTKAVAEKILNQPIDYIVRIDFNGFTKAIDKMGGIDVEVERSFEDPEYPLSGKETDTCGYTGDEFEKRATDSAVIDAFPCRFEHVSFQKGLRHMDGEVALKFVRSRHAKGPEGTDFARSKRQEKVIEAFKSKIFSLGTLANPNKLMGLYDVFKESIDTNIKENEYDDFVKLAQKVQSAKINSVVFFYTPEDERGQNLVVNPPPSAEFNNQWVIIPKAGNGNFSDIQKFVACQIKEEICTFQVNNGSGKTQSSK